MANVPKKVEERIRSELRRYQKVLEATKAKDVNESDTALIVTSMLSDLFGYDKFSEITTEYSIRSTYCDLAVKSNDDVHFLIEVKAIGQSLRDTHLRQAVDYATKEGVDWVVLTNGIEWQAHRVLFQRPVEYEMVFDLNLLEVSYRASDVIEKLYLLTKEGIRKSAIAVYHEEKQATSRFIIGAIILSDPVLNIIRRELRKMSKAARIDKDELCELIKNDVLKREVVKGDKAAEAAKRTKKSKKTHQVKPPSQRPEVKTIEKETPGLGTK